MQSDVLFAFVKLAAGPFLLIVAATVMALVYRLWLQKRITDRHHSQSEEFVNATGEGLQLLTRAAVDIPPIPLDHAARHPREEAMRVTARVRLAYVAAWLAYAAVVTTLIVHYGKPGLRSDGRMAIAYALLAPQILILLWAIRVPLRWRWLVFLIYTIAGIAMATFSERMVTILSYVPGPLALLPIGALLILFVRRLQPFLIFLLTIFGVFVGFSTTYDRFKPESVEKILEMVKANPWLLAISLAGVVAGLAITFALPRLRWPIRISAIMVVVAGMLLLERQITHGHLPIFLQVLFFLILSILEICALWMLCKAFVWLQGRQTVTNDLIHIHLCWGFLTAFVLATTLAAFYRDVIPVRWGFVLAFVLHLFVLHTLLAFLRSIHPNSPEHRLLLLRVFGRSDERETLLDDLNDTWRRIGAIDLIAATDVTSRTLGSAMLEAFVLQHSDEQFLKTKADIQKRLASQRSAIEADVRYPVNSYYCYPSIWHEVFESLANASSLVVLMDVRGFTAKNEGCAWELKYLLRHNPLSRIVLIKDDETDEKELEVIVRNAPGPGTVTALDFGRRTNETRQALFALLLKAAHEPDVAPTRRTSRA